ALGSTDVAHWAAEPRRATDRCFERSVGCVFVVSRTDCSEQQSVARDTMSCPYGHPRKNAATKSKKSWEFTVFVLLKSAAGLPRKKALRKSKKSWELTKPSALKSAGHGAGRSWSVSNSPNWRFGPVKLSRERGR